MLIDPRRSDIRSTACPLGVISIGNILQVQEKLEVFSDILPLSNLELINKKNKMSHVSRQFVVNFLKTNIFHSSNDNGTR